MKSSILLSAMHGLARERKTSVQADLFLSPGQIRSVYHGSLFLLIKDVSAPAPAFSRLHKLGVLVDDGRTMHMIHFHQSCTERSHTH